MEENLSPQQFEKALKLCDLLNLEDFYVSTTILESYQWDLEKAINDLTSAPEQNPPQQPHLVKPPEDNFNYDMDNEEDFSDPPQFQYEYADAGLEHKRKMFEDQYVTVVPLHKTLSENRKYLDNSVLKDQILSEQYHNHRSYYQKKLLVQSEILCKQILNSQSGPISKYYESKEKTDRNRQFITHLHKTYKNKINFTFGTFFLNLTRSYLDNKFLLVYIHSEEKIVNRSLEMLLNQREIANFVSNHCVAYGMFDNSDDYELLQNYVPLKNIPAFVLFRFDKKGRKEQFISLYSILQKQPQNFLEWLSSNIGISLKKKEVKKEEAEESGGFKISDIVFEQNFEYEEMEKLYQLKKQKSEIRKVKSKNFKEELEEGRQNFQQQPQASEKVITMKFRMPISGSSKMRRFSREDLVQKLFDYVSYFCRDQFQEKCSDFDLTQTFPNLSLLDSQDKTIGQVFPDSERENIIVKEL